MRRCALTYANSLLAPPIVAMRLLQRWEMLPLSEDIYADGAVNRLLGAALQAEAGWLRRRNLPVGTSLFVVAVRPQRFETIAYDMTSFASDGRSRFTARHAQAGPLVCTVLPTYNERDNIGPLIEGVLASAITPHVVLVVDDNSPDGTGDVVQQLAAEHNSDGVLRVALYTRTGQKGLTSAIQAGIDLASRHA